MFLQMTIIHNHVNVTKLSIVSQISKSADFATRTERISGQMDINKGGVKINTPKILPLGKAKIFLHCSRLIRIFAPDFKSDYNKVYE